MLAGVKVEQSKVDIQDSAQGDEVPKFWKDTDMGKETPEDDITSALKISPRIALYRVSRMKRRMICLPRCITPESTARQALCHVSSEEGLTKALTMLSMLQLVSSRM